MGKKQSVLSEQEQASLKEGYHLAEMFQTKGYQEVYKPFLEAKRDQSFPDPSQFTKEEDFTYAAKTASVFKKVIAELLNIEAIKAKEVEALKKKEKGEVEDDNFNIGV